MRIAFLTNKTAEVSLPIFDVLVTSQQVELVHAFFFDNIAQHKQSLIKVALERGPRKVAAMVLQTGASVVRRKVGKLIPRLAKANSPYELAVIKRLPHSIIADINQGNIIERIRELNLDALIVCVCSNILKTEVLSVSNMHFINIHPSLLPKYRGPAPAFWMLFHNETETGVTFHLMTPKIDQGNILRQLKMPLDRIKSEIEIERDAFELAATAVESVLRDVAENGDQRSTQQDQNLASYFSFPTPAQRHELKARIRGNLSDR